ncbi:MAG: penicillin acylase family protein [Woeseia sp.]|nr:penicillin acylase family protein [Woeseia sp.]MBT8095575.1 penicillin acylase family protein [Woeseia sp.]NNE61255.1 penicillin acylase family protein [Woeseia sp.]NNL53572.1 penicillin acylase family protein [Woeseia sp.]
MIRLFARWTKRLLLTVVILLAIAVLLAWATLRASLPQLDGEFAVAGITAPVSIERDAIGAPTLHAQNRNDLAFATGFVHAQDRFFQMDLSRRNAAGELAELIGAALLARDRRVRMHRFRARAGEFLLQQNAQEKALLDAYAAGVNAALAAMDAKPFEYHVLQSEPERWEPVDSLLTGFSMFLDLNDERADRDVQRGFAARVLPAEVFDWMYPEGTRWDAPIMGDARAESVIPGADLIDLRDLRLPTANLVVPVDVPLPGSNNWAVTGALTAEGRAIVADDMHLGLRVPSVFYRARLKYDEPAAVDLAGVTLPGVPILVAGSNGHVAWAFTNSYGDWSDAIIVRPGSKRGTYLTPDGEKRFAEFRELIKVRDAATEELVVRETVWGPVRDDVVYPEGEIAVSWIAQEPGGLNLRQIDLETVRSVAEVIDVANAIGQPPQNFVSGDADGNIVWTIAGQIPLRDGYDSELPVDGAIYRGFVGWLPSDTYPRVVNPETGRIWTANARVVDGEALAIVGDSGYALGARARQIRDGLFARDSFTPQDMLAIQLDDRALFLSRWRDLLLGVLDENAVAGNEARAQYRDQVRDWIPRASTDSVGFRLVRDFRNRVKATVFEMLTMPIRAAYPFPVPLRMSRQFEAPLWAMVTEQPAHLLTGNFDSWEALMLSVIDSNLNDLQGRPGGLGERTWGEVNRAAIRHPLSPSLPWFSRWLDMPREPLPGDNDMPRVQAPATGASERFAVAPGDEANGYLHLPAGQSGHPLSPFYRLGHADWVAGRPTPFLPGPAAHRLTLTPAP